LGIAYDSFENCVEREGQLAFEACGKSRFGGGWLNSAEILGQLLVTWHMTGEQKYYDEYERLYTEERYGEMLVMNDDTLTITSRKHANNSDHELAMLAYTTYLRYEPHADRRAKVVESLLEFYEYEREEHHPWEIAVIGSAHSGDVDVDGAIQTLKDFPIDWRNWDFDNSHRLDAEVDQWTERFGRPIFTRVFPYDEIRVMKWNKNPYAISIAGNGQRSTVPTPFLIAYWMQRYYQMIQ